MRVFGPSIPVMKLYDFNAQGVTLRGKALATKNIFQNYSQLLDNFTRLILITADNQHADLY